MAIWSIRGYQKWISPHKGFRCAHTAYYGGKSCSAAIVEFIETLPCRKLPVAIKQRFQECQRASKKLNGGRNRKRRNPNNSEADCCFWVSWDMCWPD
ncbi:membrane protein insertion efficiency factor YidD [Photobacterium sp. R1]